MLALSVLALSVIPQDHLQTFNLETAVTKVENDLRYARELALTTNTNCGINFIANGSYTLYQSSSALPFTNPLTKQPFVYNLANEFRNVNVQNSIQVEFNFLGRPVIGSGQTIQIGNGLTTANLLVIPNTGVVERQ